MSKLTEQNVHTAASMVLKIRGKEVGRANGVDITADFGLQAVPEGIGSISPAEHVALEYRADLSVTSFFIRRRSSQAKGPGVVDVLGVPVNTDILLTEPFQLILVDKVTGEVLLSCDDCSWSNVSFSIRQGAITGKDARAACIRVRQAANYQPPISDDQVPFII